MKNKCTIYGVILIIICIIELTGLVQYSAGWNFIVACSNLDMVDMGIYFILSLPLLLLITVIIWQLRNKKALQCKKLIIISTLYQLYVLQNFTALFMDTSDSIFNNGTNHSVLSYMTWRNVFDICIVLLFFVFIRKFKIEGKKYEQVRITWQSVYRKRVPIVICVILLIAGIVGYPYVKYEYYERSPYYYRLDSDGYIPANWQITYMIAGADILQQTDSYYYWDYFKNYKIGWVFKAKKIGETKIVLQTTHQSGDIEKKTYTIHVDQDKKIEVTGVREIRIEKKY